MGGFRVRLGVEGVGVPFLLAPQSVLGCLQLLDALEVGYWPMIHRATVKRVFSLGFSLTPVLIPLALVTVAYLLWSERYREVLVSSFALVGFYLVLGRFLLHQRR